MVTWATAQWSTALTSLLREDTAQVVRPLEAHVERQAELSSRGPAGRQRRALSGV